MYYEVYVSSDIKFTDFEFDGITYKYVASKFSNGVVAPKNTQGIRVTSLERTVVDSIKDFEKIGGLEELLNCISLVHYLDEKQLIAYLNAYNLHFLYQKTGFILGHYKNELQISDEFIDYCKRKINKSTRYLTKDNGTYYSEWKLVVPNDFFGITEQGGTPLV